VGGGKREVNYLLSNTTGHRNIGDSFVIKLKLEPLEISHSMNATTTLFLTRIQIYDDLFF